MRQPPERPEQPRQERSRRKLREVAEEVQVRGIQESRRQDEACTVPLQRLAKAVRAQHPEGAPQHRRAEDGIGEAQARPAQQQRRVQRDRAAVVEDRRAVAVVQRREEAGPDQPVAHGVVEADQPDEVQDTVGGRRVQAAQEGHGKRHEYRRQRNSGQQHPKAARHRSQRVNVPRTPGRRYDLAPDVRLSDHDCMVAPHSSGRQAGVLY